MDLDAIQTHNEQQAQNAEERAKLEDTAFALSKILDSQKGVENSVKDSILALVKFLAKNEPKVSVTNQQPFPKYDEVVKAVKEVVAEVKNSNKKLTTVEQKEADYSPIVSKLEKLAEIVSRLPKPVDKVSVTNQTDYSGKFDEVTKAVQGIDIPAPIVNVEKPVIPDNSKELDKLLKAVEKIKFPDIPKTDLKPLIEATKKVGSTIANLSFPVPNYVLPFKNSAGAATQVQLDENGNLPIEATPIVVDTNNSTTTPLAAGATFTGTATNILGYQQQGISLFFRPNVIPSGDASTAKGSFFFEYSDDGTNWDISVPIVVRSGIFIPHSPITVKKWFRIRYVNDGGTSAIANLGLSETAGTPTTQTVFRMTTLLYPQPTKELARTMDQNITGSDPATLVISTDMGKQPDGDYFKAKADGTVYTTTSALNASAIYTGAWFDSDGWRSIELFIATDQISGVDGVEIQFTDDVGAATPTLRGSIKRSFTLDDVARGFLTIRTAVTLDGFRIKYTNGGVTQGSFFLQANVRVDNVEAPQSNYNSTIGPTNNALMTRGSLVAKNSGGTFADIERGSSSGLDIGIVQHEVETPIKSLAGLRITRTTVTATSVKIVTTPFTNRRSLAIRAVASGSALVYIGTNSSVSAGTGHPLADGQAIDLDLDDTVTEIWAIASSGTQAVSVAEVST